MTKQIIFGSPEAKAIAAADRLRAAALEEIERDFGSVKDFLDRIYAAKREAEEAEEEYEEADRRLRAAYEEAAELDKLRQAAGL